jgi:hypothetical protein
MKKSYFSSYNSVKMLIFLIRLKIKIFNCSLTIKLNKILIILLINKILFERVLLQLFLKSKKY